MLTTRNLVYMMNYLWLISVASDVQYARFARERDAVLARVAQGHPGIERPAPWLLVAGSAAMKCVTLVSPMLLLYPRCSEFEIGLTGFRMSPG